MSDVKSNKSEASQKKGPKVDPNQYKILSLDGSEILQSQINKEVGFSIRNKNGKVDFTKFEGYLDKSLETIHLRKVYKKHKEAFQEKFYFYPRSNKQSQDENQPRTENKSKKDKRIYYTLALINVSFDYTIKEYRQVKGGNGYLYIRDGYDVRDNKWIDHESKDHKLENHVLTVEEDGKKVLIAIEVPYPQDTVTADAKYARVDTSLDQSLLSPYFAYDGQNKCYIRAEQIKKKADETPDGETDKKTAEVPFKTIKDSKQTRDELYKNGFLCDGIKYVRYKRSAGSSRDGQCLFIPEVLYDDMMAWSSCGIDGKKIEDQASFQAYMSLTLSSIQQTINLSQKSILILPDRDSEFTEKAVRVYRNKETNGLDAAVEDVTIKNKIWDGEALLDKSVFEENNLADKGMMLLRNRFFKTCAFNTNLQQYFADNDITDIKQLNGCYHRGANLADIKMVITESSLKYCKMLPKEKTLKQKFDAWTKIAFVGDTSDFGLVKTEKPTGIMGGNMVRTNYQMLNTIGLTQDEVPGFLKDSLDLLHNMMKDPAYLRYYINLFVNTDDPDDTDAYVTTINFRTEAITEMLSRSDDFAQTQCFCEFRGDVLDSYKRKMKAGRIAVDGTYATLFGNGAEFLRAVIDKDYTAAEPLALKGNEIRTTQFDYDKDLLCARSPHITMGNLFLAKNVNHETYEKYFNFENAHEIVCINAINNNIQQRLNGCDYDSDTMLITDNKILLNAAARDEKHFPVPVADFDKDNDFDKKDEEKAPPRFDNPESIAELDRKIAENRIGEIVNLSQFMNSLYWDKISKVYACEDKEEKEKECQELYMDICKLAVLSGVEIDKAKRSNKVNANTVLDELQKKYKMPYKEENHDQLPAFYTFLTTGEVVKSTATLNAPMSLIYDAVEKDKTKAPKVPKYKRLSDLVKINPNDKGKGLDDHRKKAVLKAAESFKNTLAKCNIKMRGNSPCEIMNEREKMDKAFEDAKKSGTDNLANDHVLSLVLKELDKATQAKTDEAREKAQRARSDNKQGKNTSTEKSEKEKNKKTVSPYYFHLFAILVFEENHRFLKRVIQSAEKQYNLVYAPDEQNPEIRIFGYPHFKQPVAVTSRKSKAKKT